MAVILKSSALQRFRQVQRERPVPGLEALGPVAIPWAPWCCVSNFAPQASRAATTLAGLVDTLPRPYCSQDEARSASSVAVANSFCLNRARLCGQIAG